MPRARGGGEVWAVRDKLGDRTLALKILSEGAGEAEVLALVRGRWRSPVSKGSASRRSSRSGRSARAGGGTWCASSSWAKPRRRSGRGEGRPARAFGARVRSTDGDPSRGLAPRRSQAGEHHRRRRGRGTLVDLGLAAPWRDGGTSAQGLTPKYAAPELFAGADHRTRRGVRALGATLGEGLARRGWQMDDGKRVALAKVAARADRRAERSLPERRRTRERAAAAGLTAPGVTKTRADAAWPVVGLEATAERLAAAARARAGPKRSPSKGPRARGERRRSPPAGSHGRLGVEGRAVAAIEAPRPGMTAHEAVELELATWRDAIAKLTIVVDDADALDEAARVALRAASEQGARLVGVGGRQALSRIAKGRCSTFDVPPLDDAVAEELVRRAMPSLPDALRARLVARAESRLRSMMRSLAGRVEGGHRAPHEQSSATASSSGGTSNVEQPPLRDARQRLLIGHLRRRAAPLLGRCAKLARAASSSASASSTTIVSFAIASRHVASSSSTASCAVMPGRGASIAATARPSTPSVHATRRASVVRPEPAGPSTASASPGPRRAPRREPFGGRFEADDGPRRIGARVFVTPGAVSPAACRSALRRRRRSGNDRSLRRRSRARRHFASATRLAASSICQPRRASLARRRRRARKPRRVR